ncbi:MAG: hypothetical protein ACRD20_09675 [Terriglobales bacterium]
MRLPHLVTSFLWFLPIALQFAIALVMVRRRLIREFPVFFSYTVLVPTRDFVLARLPYGRSLYSTVYWWGDGLAVLLSLGVIFETAWHFVRPYPFLRVILKVLWVTSVPAGAAAFALLIWAGGPRGADLALEWIILGERSARFLQVCLLIVAIALMSRLGLTWRQYSVGIAAGFGVYSALDLVLLELRAPLHVISNAAFVFVRPAAYNLGVAIWAFYFLWPQGGKPVDRLPVNDLANWNETLTQQVDKWYRR